MTDVGGWINGLYTNYLARDFVAKVIPGFILLASFMFGPPSKLRPDDFLRDLPLLAWPFIYGICLAIGFSIQAFGELTRWARIFPRGEKRGDSIPRMVKLHRTSQPWAIQQRERYVVIKEMSANVSLALIYSVILIAVSLIGPRFAIAVRLLVIALAIVMLGWYQWAQVRDQRTFELEASKDAPETDGV